MMTKIFWIIVGLGVVTMSVFDALGWFRRRALKKHNEQFLVKIQEPRVKLLFNPFEDKMYWARLNPMSRIWEWRREATSDEIEHWDTFRNEDEKQLGVPYLGEI